MSKFVPDISSKRWVIISPSRIKRPDENGNRKKKKCIFCPGNESLTPDEIYRLGPGEPNTPGWKVRVIKNKYPIADIHEVIIHSPHEEHDIEALPLAQVSNLFKTYRERFNTHRKQGQVLIFCNHGEHAGASIEHPHSQLVVIPSQINFDTLSREPMNNIVRENTFFNVYCPDFSQWPYEVWIAPKKEGTIFGDINDEEIDDLVEILQHALKQLIKIYKENKLSNLGFGYNYYIYPRENWYIRIIPRFIHRAGFELGTGLSVNIVDPAEAAIELRGINQDMLKVLSKLKKY